MRSSVKARYVIPVAVFLIVSILVACLKVIQVDQQLGDTALYFQITENIANRGVPLCNICATAQDALKPQGLASMTAQQIGSLPSLPASTREMNYLRFHVHLILYLIAPFVRIFPTNVVLMSLFVFSLTSVVLLAYFILRSKGVAIGAAVLFCLLVVSHPAWSEAFWWQFYPERIFVLAGFILMYLATKNDAKKPALITAALACMLISERSAIMAGLYLILYSLLFWKESRTDTYFRLGLGALAFLFGVLVLKFVITNVEYSDFFPRSFGELVRLFKNVAFTQDLALFALINGVFLIVALFNWRLALIAFLFMLPNVFGTTGGGEKIGWYSHHHDLYLPALLFAALMGYAAAYRKAVSKKQLPAFYAGIIVVILFLASVDPYSAKRISISPSNLSNEFFVRAAQEANYYLSPAGRAHEALFDEIAKAVPTGSIVSSPEETMPELYSRRTIQLLPAGIDDADYAVLTTAVQDDGTTSYGGADTNLGQAERAKIDKVVVARMKKDGYDFEHAVLISDIHIAVVKRLKRKE